MHSKLFHLSYIGWSVGDGVYPSEVDRNVIAYPGPGPAKVIGEARPGRAVTFRIRSRIQHRSQKLPRTGTVTYCTRELSGRASCLETKLIPLSTLLSSPFS